MKTLATVMREALYGADGYYNAGHARTGIKGDYFTAPETGQAFGELLAVIFYGWRERLKADPFWILEAGAGEGRLMQSLIRPGGAYGVIERSPTRREKIRRLNLPVDIHSDLSEIKKASVTGVIFANELIDAFPVHRVRMKNGMLEEMHLDGQETIQWSAPSTPRLSSYFDRLKIALPEGYETEVNLQMADWLRDASSVLQRGLVVLIDYGRPAWDYYAEERAGGTLRGFKGHRVLGLPELLTEGPQADWTADVDFTSAALDAKAAGLEPLAFMEMGTFLKLGVKSEAWRVEGNTTSFSKPSTLHPFTDLLHLLHPEGMGAQFHVLILGKNLDPNEWPFDHNRLARLGLGA